MYSGDALGSSARSGHGKALAAVIQEAYVHCIVAADSSKFDRSTLVRVCPLDAVDLLVTDSLPGLDLTRGLEAAGVAIHVADRT